jgi:hypothetical protein
VSRAGIGGPPVAHGTGTGELSVDLATNVAKALLGQSDAEISQPTFSLDGRWIAYQQSMGEEDEILAVRRLARWFRFLSCGRR